MTGRVFDDVVVEAAALAMYPRGHHLMCAHDPCACYFRGYTANAAAALTAAADALEGAIRAEALAPVAALIEQEEERSSRWVVRRIRAVIADPDAVAKHNAAIAAKALNDAADAWQHGQWADAPRRADRIEERIANGQHVTDWLRARTKGADHG